MRGEYMASPEEQRRAMPADSIVTDAIYAETRAITICAPVERVWPWLAQLGSGRGGWYAFDWVDNGGHPSARSILPQFQHIAPGDVMPALPGVKDVFRVSVVDPPRHLVLTVPDVPDGSRVSWEFLLEAVERGHSRLIVRGRVSAHWLDPVPQDSRTGRPAPTLIERVYGQLPRLPRPIMLVAVRFGHGLMQVRQLRGIKARAEGR